MKKKIEQPKELKEQLPIGFGSRIKRLARTYGKIKTGSITVGTTSLVMADKMSPELIKRLFKHIFAKVPEKEDRYNRLPKPKSYLDLVFDGNMA